MPKSRRYMACALPLEHINGKMTNTSVKCPNTESGGVSPSGGFMYGYRRARSRVSRFGYRINSRSLTEHPYSTSETAARSTFAQSSAVVAAALLNPAQLALIAADFRKQSSCSTLRGFAIGVVIKNGGTLPENWRV